MKLISLFAGVLSFAAPGAQAASPLDSITWTTYDSFAGPSLDTSLWSGGSGGTLTTGASGLTLSPATVTAPVNQYLFAKLPIANGTFVAAQMPFSATGSAGAGGEVSVGIAIGNTSGTQQEAIWWGNVNGYSLDGPVVTGNIFASDLTTGNVPLTFVPTVVTQGVFGILYDGSIISTYYNVGAGWQQIGIPVSTSGWGDLVFALGAATRVVPPATPFSANIPLVQISQLAPIPEPATSLLWLAGLALVAALAHLSSMRTR